MAVTPLCHYGIEWSYFHARLNPSFSRPLCFHVHRLINGMDISNKLSLRFFFAVGRVSAWIFFTRSVKNFYTNFEPHLKGNHGHAKFLLGSLTNLAKAPASTVQILGAEKALFRALKTRGNTPKYGLIFHSSFIGRAGAKNKGRISRYLANKCSIASRYSVYCLYTVCPGSSDPIYIFIYIYIRPPAHSKLIRRRKKLYLKRRRGGGDDRNAQ